MLGIAFSADGIRVVAASNDALRSFVCEWPIGAGEPSVRELDDQLTAVAFGAHGEMLSARAGDHALVLKRGPEAADQILLPPHPSWVGALGLASDAHAAFWGDENGGVGIWRFGDVRGVRMLQRRGGRVDAIAVSADGRRLASAGHDGTVHVWDVEGSLVRTIRIGTDAVLALALSADGTRALTGGWEGRVGLWDVDAGDRILDLGSHDSRVSSVALSSDGRLALSGGFDATARLWRIRDGAELATLRGHRDAVVSVSISPDSALGATADADGIVKVWNLATASEIGCNEREGSMGAGGRSPFADIGRNTSVSERE